MAFSQIMLCFITFSCSLHITEPLSMNQDTLLQSHQFTKTNRLISSSGWCTLSFFQCDDSEGFYLGVRPSADNSCYAYLWVANRDTPIPDPRLLTIDQHGSLKIISGNSTIMLYSSQAQGNNSVSAILQDNGNFMLRELNQDGSVKRLLWQSFDYPTDTFIPGMKIGFDRKTGQNWSLTSWRSQKSPISGSFTFGIDPITKELVIWWRGNIFWNSGPWKNGSFVNLKSSVYQKDFVFKYFSDENSTYVTYVPIGYLYLGSSGSLYGGVSGALYSCIGNNFLSGCSLPSPPKCRQEDILYSGNWSSYGVMSSKGFKFDERENLSNFDCWMKCLNNCSCEAYSYVNDDGTGCEIWSRDSAKFVATNNLKSGGRYIYFINKKKGKAKIWIISAIVGPIVLIILCFTCYKLWRKLKEKAENSKKQTKLLSETGGSTGISIVYSETKEQMKDEMPSDDTNIFDFQTILEATDNFSSTNKIGQGGFGPVYKGKLPNGQEVAIKRLSKSSGQGLTEFRNEAMLIVKLQHTNLVRLLGFCSHKEERILVYEYLPNKSLNIYLFDANKKSILEWKIRCKIIEGVAQGLVYLHQYSRLTVIHRDLKASNILLDNELNPKISDFGMARIFKLKESEEHTNRVVGTYGYMSPEYAMMGVISTKTDVYSFGILLLEILSGKKNSYEYPVNIVFYAWKLWNEREALKLMDTTLDESYSHMQALRYIHIGLLCAQDQASDRPTMLEVVSFLSNETACLPPPKQPGLLCDIGVMAEMEQHSSWSINDTTNTLTSGKAKIWIISAIVGTLVLIILCFTFYKLWRKLKGKVENRKKRTELLCEIGGNTAISMDYNEKREQRKDGRTSDDNMHIFELQTILEATDNFSLTNKIGQGGFGPVYKGKLPSGQEIAIKRLSKRSGQGLIEFKNEAMLIVKLQHTNLVRLLGFCIDNEERILVYEYFPNKSMNLYLFDSAKKGILDWKIRCKIIEGVAQGLVYLHQYSRVKVIHRDLKASNILLDNEFNPKISDFGTARIFGLTESEEQTNRIVGTLGYMSPEYAMMGVISTKTDVYSFGILLLEILSGKKNSIDNPFNLVVHAWKLWNEGEALELMDTTLYGSYSPTQVLRCIHIGLLCTQDKVKDRPTMLEVVSFLSNENGHLPQPKQPAICIIGEFGDMEESEQQNSCSINETTNSLTSGR